jgi:exopolyphosphatase/guanosine-5'-triphosphate,3'-diphosphate pyrophosphatase
MPDVRGIIRRMSVRRLAAIDVGSNALRLHIVERDGLRDVFRDRASVRLGDDAFRHGRLSRRTLDAAVAALAEFRAKMRRASVVAYRAVATSAARSSTNAAELLRRARREAGVDLELIDGIEEARLVSVGVAKNVRLWGRTVLLDVGGGSTEVSVFEGARKTFASSLPLGTVRMLADFDPGPEPIRRRTVAAIGEAFDEELVTIGPKLARADRLIVAGGTATAFVQLCAERGAVTPARMADVLDDLRRCPEEERAARHGLRPDRADTIVLAGLVVHGTALRTAARSIEAPGVGLRHGVLAELARDRPRTRRVSPAYAVSA